MWRRANEEQLDAYGLFLIHVFDVYALAGLAAMVYGVVIPQHLVWFWFFWFALI